MSTEAQDESIINARMKGATRLISIVLTRIDRKPAGDAALGVPPAVCQFAQNLAGKALKPLYLSNVDKCLFFAAVQFAA